MSDDIFPNTADYILRDQIAEAFLSARRDGETSKIIADPVTAQRLASIAVTIFHKSERK